MSIKPSPLVINSNFKILVNKLSIIFPFFEKQPLKSLSELKSNLEALKKTDKISYRDELFGIKKRIKVRHFSQKTEFVPEVDNSYIFDEITTLSILAGFNHNKRVFLKYLFCPILKFFLIYNF